MGLGSLGLTGDRKSRKVTGSPPHPQPGIDSSRSVLLEGFAECGIIVSTGSVLAWTSKVKASEFGSDISTGGEGSVLSQKKGWLSCRRVGSPEPLHPQDYHREPRATAYLSLRSSKQKGLFLVLSGSETQPLSL